MRFSEIAFTGYPVTDMARARAFYEGVLSQQSARTWGKPDDPSWLEYDIGPGCLAIINSAGAEWPPANGGPAAALEVDEFDACVKRLKDAGVKFFWEPQESPVCWMAVVLDPDGNRLVIHHRKSEPAKT